MGKTPLEAWIAERIGVGKFTKDGLEEYQLRKLRETVTWVLQYSPFYHNLLKGVGTNFSLVDFKKLPFTTDEDIRLQAAKFVCVSQDAISRVVTLESSGTTGKVKRLYFTPMEQALTIDFFQYGMASLVKKGQRVIILFPGQFPGSLGDLLKTALARLGVSAIVYGVVTNISEALEIILKEKVQSIVGIPSQVLALARYAKYAGIDVSIKSVLLSSDYVPQAIVRELECIWGCLVVAHYGMTEMGLGGGTECIAKEGYHLHEADFYFEIVDPLTGKTVPTGQEGEVVITTLTRRGMPLIRYRTGDISRFLSSPCQCGSTVRRLARIKGRKNSEIGLSSGGQFTLADLDEQIFAVDGVANFTAAVDNEANASTLTLSVSVFELNERVKQAIDRALYRVPAIHYSCQNNKFTVNVKLVQAVDMLPSQVAKRRILGS